MGEDSQVRFTEIDKDRNLQDRVWVQIAEVDAIIDNQISEEGMNRNTKTMEEIILKHN